jgi:hypothetical protein
MGKALGFDDIASGHKPEAAPNFYSDIAVLAMPVAVNAAPRPRPPLMVNRSMPPCCLTTI